MDANIRVNSRPLAVQKGVDMGKPEKMDLRSMDIADDKRRQLAQLFPEVVTEIRDEPRMDANGRELEGVKYRYAVDFERLKGVLGEFSEILENQRERYGMTWPGKNECLKIIQQPSIATLKPRREESVNFDETENLFIEGDNLEALKLLQKAYYGKVKMIYIDPPYNTGKEFIYPDNYSENLDTYLSYTGQVDAQGRKFSTNTEAEGRFHSKWLNMMLPRLYLARNLLRDDGVIFISIDDHEVKNLRELCDEVFGEENFISDIIWEKRFTRNNDAKLMSSVIDHIILYRKSEECVRLREQRTEKSDSIYKNPDNDPRGPWTSVSYISQRTKEQRQNLSYAIRNPITGVNVTHEVNAWKYSLEQCKAHQAENRLYWGVEGNNQYPRLKRFLSELEDGIVPINLWAHKATGTIDDGTKTVDNLIGKEIFDYPKPPSLLKRMMSMSLGKDDLVLDFFSGSCTTAHAVLDLNKQDGGNRKFIMVQLPEPCDETSEAYKAGYKTIADIGKERIRRVIKKLEEEPRIDANKRESKQDALFSDSDISVNSRPLAVQTPPGFRVFKLDRSNFRLWDGSQPGEDPEKIAKQLELHEQHIDPNATQEDILYELLLKAGFPLTTKVEPLYLVDGKLQNEEPRINANERQSKDPQNHSRPFASIRGSNSPSVFAIAEGALLICLQDEITKELIKAMADADPLQVICLDSGFKNNDQLKANAVQTFKSRNKSAETATVFRTV
jgi:adenine-specific DNA-methyltransferase